MAIQWDMVIPTEVIIMGNILTKGMAIRIRRKDTIQKNRFFWKIKYKNQQSGCEFEIASPSFCALSQRLQCRNSDSQLKLDTSVIVDATQNDKTNTNSKHWSLQRAER